jgi:hypothetical protein
MAKKVEKQQRTITASTPATRLSLIGKYTTVNSTKSVDYKNQKKLISSQKNMAKALIKTHSANLHYNSRLIKYLS